MEGQLREYEARLGKLFTPNLRPGWLIYAAH